MIQTSLSAALVIYVVFVGVLLKECVFLAPLRAQIWQEYCEGVVYFSAALVMNLFAAVYVTHRALTLRDTGDKLSHLERQLRSGSTISAELTERILERK